MHLLHVILLGGVCGCLGGYAMTYFMRAVSAAFSKRVDMIRALGSYFDGNLEKAYRRGMVIHSLSGIFFGIVYFLIFDAMGALVFPYAPFLGIGFGFFHGLFMSYMLMFYACEKHPVEEYRDATLEEGLLHLVGHIIFGGVVGLLGGLAALAFGA